MTPIYVLAAIAAVLIAFRLGVEWLECWRYRPPDD